MINDFFEKLFFGLLKMGQVCKQYISEAMLGADCRCRKWGYLNYHVRMEFSYSCNICNHIESPSIGTLFHWAKFGLRKVFFICFKISSTIKGLSARYIAVCYEIAKNLPKLFRHGISGAMRPGDDHPVDGEVQVDEFVVNRKDDSKIDRGFCSKRKKWHERKGRSNASMLSKLETSLRVHSGVSSIPRIFGLSKFPVTVVIISKPSAL